MAIVLRIITRFLGPSTINAMNVLRSLMTQNTLPTVCEMLLFTIFDRETNFLHSFNWLKSRLSSTSSSWHTHWDGRKCVLLN